MPRLEGGQRKNSGLIRGKARSFSLSRNVQIDPGGHPDAVYWMSGAFLQGDKAVLA